MQSGRKNNSSYRWVVLAVFTAVAGVSQMLWLNFAPLITQVMDKYHQSESSASLLLLVFPLLYVVLSVPSGAMIDKRGYKFAVGFGSVLMALFSILRIFDGNFYVLLAAQVGIAVGQPFVVNGISKLVADWFSKDEHALATGLGTVGMFIGMALGMALTPALTHDGNFRSAMIVFAIISVVSAGAFLLLARENDSDGHLHTSLGVREEFILLLKQRDLVLLFAISFLALGYFNGIITWIEPILAANGFNAEQAGMAGALIILGGIVGSVIIPALSDKYRKRKPFLLACSIAGLLITYPFCVSSNYSLVLIIGVSLGFFFLPGYALLLAMSEEMAGSEKAGATTSLLMLTGNLGGVVVIILMEIVKAGGDSWMHAIYLLLGLLAVAIFLGTLVSETFDH
jgi:predicted MFS family arabinose efflux permease